MQWLKSYWSNFELKLNFGGTQMQSRGLKEQSWKEWLGWLGFKQFFILPDNKIWPVPFQQVDPLSLVPGCAQGFFIKNRIKNVILIPIRKYLRQAIETGHEKIVDDLQFFVSVVDAQTQLVIGRAVEAAEAGDSFVSKFGQLILQFFSSFRSSFPK